MREFDAGAGRGIRSGCCWGRRSRGCRSWCRSGTGGCWCRRSRSTGARRCRWRPTWPRTPTSGLRVQLCGDAHLSNFGAFASPERRLVFDVNDFDETLPGPFEWDVKRLAASLAVAGRDNGFAAKDRRKIVLAAAEGYRTAMREFAEQPLLEVWYAHLDVEQAIARVQVPDQGQEGSRPTEKMLAKAHTRDSMQALSKLTTVVDGQRRIISDPPLIVPIEELFADVQADAIYEQLRERAGQVPAHPAVRPAAPAGAVHAGPGGPQGRRGRQRRHPRLDRADGRPATGSSRCSCRPRRPSRRCWRTTAGAASTRNQGERVVAGQHLMQAQSDIFLGWTRATGPDGVDRDFYVRQLRDWKFSVPIEQMIPPGMAVYARPVRLDPGPGARPLRRPHRPGRLPRRLRPSSTRRSPTSPKPTPTRTNATTPRSRPPSRTAGPKPPPSI